MTLVTVATVAQGLSLQLEHDKDRRRQAETYPPWTDVPQSNWTRPNLAPLSTNITAAIIVPNCTNPSVDCSLIYPCLSNNQTKVTRSRIQTRQSPSNGIPVVETVNLRCNSRLYQPQMAMAFLANVRTWVIRVITRGHSPTSYWWDDEVILRSVRFPDGLPNLQLPEVAAALRDIEPATTFMATRSIWQIGFIMPPEILLEFSLLQATHTTGLEFADTWDLLRSLSNEPPQAIINFFNNPWLNGIGMDSRMLRLYRFTFLLAGRIDMSRVDFDEMEALWVFLTSSAVLMPYRTMTNDLAAYLRVRYPHSRIGDAWSVYAETVLHRAIATAAQMTGVARETLGRSQQTLPGHEPAPGGIWFEVENGHASLSDSNSSTAANKGTSGTSDKRGISIPRYENGTVDLFSNFNGSISSLTPEQRLTIRSWAYSIDASTFSNKVSIKDGTAYAISFGPNNISQIINGTT